MNVLMPSDTVGKAIRQTWMIIFADLLALLLTFFVLIFSMNAIQYEDWKSVVDSLSEELNPDRARTSQEEVAGPESNRVFRPYGIGLDYLLAVLEQNTANDSVLGGSLITRLEDRLIISLPADVVFEGDGTEVSDAGRQTIGQLATLFEQLSNGVAVSAHDDGGDLGDPNYPSGWEFTLARAAAVRELLRRAGYRSPVVAIGYGDSRLSDIDSRIAPEIRARLARRVDIIVRENVRGAAR